MKYIKIIVNTELVCVRKTMYIVTSDSNIIFRDRLRKTRGKITRDEIILAIYYKSNKHELLLKIQ